MNETVESQIHQYPAEDEWPHTPSGDDQWQESIAFTWWDDKAGIGGFHRLGHELGGASPSVNNWNGVFSREGTRFHRNVRRELRPGDQIERGFAIDGFTSFQSIVRPIYRLYAAECEIDLECDDYYPRSDLFPTTAGAVANSFAARHFEVACAVNGRVRLGDREVTVSGIGYRDHSWGKRDWGTLLSHRWIAGSFGPQMSFCALAWHAIDGTFRTFGVVVRAGKVIPCKSVDILTYLEADGTTCRGGELTFVMPDGEVIGFTAKAVDAMVSHHQNLANVDTLCTIDYNGMRGFCDFEMSNNPRNGTAPITVLLRATETGGLSRREWDHCAAV
jgi:hypothetical protein